MTSWILKRMIYTSRFPVQTFYYGELPIRIKLKPGVKFAKAARKPLKPCLGANEGDNKVYFQVGGSDDHEENFFEFWVCTADVIESVSFGAKEHYDEVLKDLAWISNPRRAKDEYTSYFQSSKGEKQIDINFSGRKFITWPQTVGGYPLPPSERYKIDGREVSLQVLIRHLRSFRRFIKTNKETILYAPDVTPDRGQHFGTNRPIYFND